jgi:hypothetical protein
MEISTPAIIFPAISMLMLAYTNRFMVISQRIRTLHEKYSKENTESVLLQIANLRQRFKLIRWMQICSASAFIMCTLCILMILTGFNPNHVTKMFGASLVSLVVSLSLALSEIVISTKAIELELQGIEDKLEKH